MNSAIPQYHEIRLTLSEMDAAFNEFVGGPDVVDVGQTIDLMLRDFFYGELAQPPLCYQSYSDQDRILVFPLGKGCTLAGNDLNIAIDNLGEIFWSMNDFITSRVLKLTPDYTHRPSDCLYKFFPMSRELVVYTPVIQNFTYPLHLVPLDGRAVITACVDTLPTHLRFT